MATASTTRLRRPSPTTSALRMSSFDRVYGMVLSLLILVGLVVVFLLVAWFSNRVFVSEPPVPVVLEALGGGSEFGVGTEGMQLDSPQPIDVARESDLETTAVEETLLSVSSAVTTASARFSDPLLADPAAEGGGNRQTGTGNQLAYGSGEGPAGVPRAQRWEIRFGEGNTLESYARQLDFFGIELGVLGARDEVIYVGKLSQAQPERRLAKRSAEERLRMVWREGALAAVDQQLMTRAGLDTRGKVIFQFYPAEIENQLATLEQQYAGRKPTEIRRTRFGVRRSGEGYEFFVVNQSYR